jgi:hypothetical protein
MKEAAEAGHRRAAGRPRADASRPPWPSHALARALAGLLLAGATGASAAQEGRRVERVALPSGATVVVAEGDQEPRSIGSYALRLYARGDPAFPTDAFVAGTVRARDGGIERVLVEDLDRDGRPEVVVVVRSVGSGGHLQADAFSIGTRRVALRAAVSGLPKDADPVAELRSRMRARTVP